MRKIYILMLQVFFICCISTWYSYANTDNVVCGTQRWAELFNCRVDYSCEQYRSEKPVYNREMYPSIAGTEVPYSRWEIISPVLENAKSLYRKNIGNIYQCWLIQTQRNTLVELDTLLKQESQGEISDTIGKKIQDRLERLEKQSKALKCALTDDEIVYNKLNILREATFEVCRYTTYLEWIREHHENISNYVPPAWKDRFSWVDIAKILDGVKIQINDEITHTFRVFPLAYHAYWEYENHFALHFLLQIIEADYKVLRDRLYETMMPIAQLWYKVINAMAY